MTDELMELATWSAAYVNDLPDSAFLFVEDGDQDEQGKTTPRSLRHFPYKDANGAVDLPHLRNALARIPQSNLPQAVKDRATAKAQQLLADATNQSEPDELVTTEAPPLDGKLTLDLPEEPLMTLDAPKRRLGLRIVPWNIVAMSKYGPIMFEPHAFGDVDPASVRLRMDHIDPPTGMGESYQERPEAAYMDFAVSKTQRGTDQLTLATDGVSRGASVGYREVAGGPKMRTIDGQRVRVYPPNSAVLEEVSTTWQPTFSDAGVMYAMSRKEDQVTTETEETQEVRTTTVVDPALGEAIQTLSKGQQTAFERMQASIERMEENSRKQIDFPRGAPAEERKPKLHAWTEMALRMMRGQTVSPTALKELALDDVITGDNPGLVPDVLVRDFDDLITSARPFLSSTRRITAPPTGTSLILPYLTQRAQAGSQSAEKAEVTGTAAPKVGILTFPYVSVFGGADVAIQMLNRADASFFDLLTQELAEAFALDEEEKAIAELLNPSDMNAGSPDDGGTIDAENLLVGSAWQTSISVYRRAPDTMWMNAAAVAAFIDAKSPTTYAPLYSNLAASFTAGGGAGGTISGLRPIYVPAMDDADVDVIIGPSRAYVWAEDPTRNLQVDVPSRAGRDIALVGGIFLAPRFASAFTTYTLGSS